MTHAIFLQVLTLKIFLIEEPRLFIDIAHNLYFCFINWKHKKKIILIPEGFGYHQCFGFNLREQHCDTENCDRFLMSSGRWTAGRPATNPITWCTMIINSRAYFSERCQPVHEVKKQQWTTLRMQRMSTADESCPLLVYDTQPVSWKTTVFPKTKDFGAW